MIQRELISKMQIINNRSKFHGRNEEQEINRKKYFKEIQDWDVPIFDTYHFENTVLCNDTLKILYDILYTVS